jgi:hypothetical protein
VPSQQLADCPLSLPRCGIGTTCAGLKRSTPIWRVARLPRTRQHSALHLHCTPPHTYKTHEQPPPACGAVQTTRVDAVVFYRLLLPHRPETVHRRRSVLCGGHFPLGALAHERALRRQLLRHRLQLSESPLALLQLPVCAAAAWSRRVSARMHGTRRVRCMAQASYPRAERALPTGASGCGASATSPRSRAHCNASSLSRHQRRNRVSERGVRCAMVHTISYPPVTCEDRLPAHGRRVDPMQRG